MPNNKSSVLKKAKNRNIVLFLAMLLLASAVYAVKEYKLKKNLIHLPIDVLQLDEIIIQQTPAITLKKIDGTWHVIQGGPSPANKKAMQNIFDMLSSPVRDEYSVADISLKELSLDPPNLKVELNGETLAFGTLSPLEQMHYVHFRDKVYLASPFLQVRFNQSLKAFMKPNEEIEKTKNEYLHGEH